MVKLLAKNLSDGQYFFIEDGEDKVYRIVPPLAESQKEFVDSLHVFMRRSLDTDIAYEERDFNSIEELRTFAIQDCMPETRGIMLNSHEKYEDLLIYAPLEIVEEYYAMIEKMIKNKEYDGLELYFKQLSMNLEVLDNESLRIRLREFRDKYNYARFPNIQVVIERYTFGTLKSRIQNGRSVISTAKTRSVHSIAASG